MTITVQTKDYGAITLLRGKTYEIVDEVLFVADEDSTDVAIFAKGEWAYVLDGEEIEESTEKAEPRKPRTWDSFDEIPEGVAVRDKDGDTWYFNEIVEEIKYRSSDGRPLNPWAPYTEVIL